MAKSYFAILGVATGASSEEIKSAYRRLVKEYHPDRHEGDSTAFRQIQEAYSVLGDRRRRDEYVRAMEKPPRTGRGGSAGHYPAAEPLIPPPIASFEAFTGSFGEGFERLWDNFLSPDPPNPGRVRSLTMEVPLTRRQARAGGKVRIMVPARGVCPDCRGHGIVGLYACARCSGEGAVSGEVPVSVVFPPGLSADHAVVIPLQRFGIRNLHLTIRFRPADD